MFILAFQARFPKRDIFVELAKCKHSSFRACILVSRELDCLWGSSASQNQFLFLERLHLFILRRESATDMMHPREQSPPR
jgi:hypothetical protein